MSAGKPVLLPSSIGLTLDAGRVIGALPKVRATTTRTVDQVLRPVVRVKRAEVRDRFNERRIDFAGDYSLIVRAYDDGVAYRFVTTIAGDIEVRAEDASFRFAGDHRLYFPEETSFLSHQERSYKRLRIGEVGTQVLVAAGHRRDRRAEDRDYRGGPLRLSRHGSDRRERAEQPEGALPVLPGEGRAGARPRREGASSASPTWRRQPARASSPGACSSWPAADTTLLDTDIVYRLASESRIGDTSWIRPGKVAWDWWNFNNIYGVPFRAGVNTDTYKHYIDFAAENGIEYVILDEGWYKLGDLMTQMPGIDMEAIAAHARAEEGRPGDVGDLEDARPADGAGARPVREVGREGDQGGLHAARGPVDGQLLRAGGARGGEAAPAGGLPRRLQADGPLPDLSERRHERGRARPRAEQVGRPRVARQRRHVPVHADDGGAGGLHAWRDDERDEGRLQAGLQPADEPGHALPAARDVRRLREPAADAGRLAVELPARAREPGVPVGRPDRVGRDEGAVGRGRRAHPRGAAERQRRGTSGR